MYALESEIEEMDNIENMTRINAFIPPKYLLDEHLRAEAREIGRLGSYAAKRVKCNYFVPMPSEFTLGLGHVRFFMNKGIFIAERMIKIERECILRGFIKSAELCDAGSRINLKERWPEEGKWNTNYYGGWAYQSLGKFKKSHIINLLFKRFIKRIPIKPHYYSKLLTQYQAKVMIDNFKLELLEMVDNSDLIR